MSDKVDHADVSGTGRGKSPERKQLAEAYVNYLVKRRAERSPEMAHQFALAMKHKGMPLNQSVAEFIIAFEGALPQYWSSSASADEV